MDMPPSRYKVVEKGRRLVVVDTYSGAMVTGAHPSLDGRERVTRPAARAPDRPAPTPPRKQATAPTGTITTRPWYDDKAPRTLEIPESASNTWLIVAAILAACALVVWYLFGFFGLFVIGFFLLQTGLRKGLRKAVTGWLDQFDEA